MRKTGLLVGVLNFFFPGLGLASVLGRSSIPSSFVSWVTLVALQLLALAGAVSPEMPGDRVWLILLLGHNISSGVTAALAARAAR